MFAFLATKMALPEIWSYFIIIFFIYSFLGNIMECIVLTIEHRRPITNRGFVRHLPFCIIYGFGALAGYFVLSPLSSNWLLLFLAGAVGGSVFEFVTAQVMLRTFGDFWWDYSKKPLNFKGILCFESTLGWGFVALVVINLLHPLMAWLVSKIPLNITYVAAPLLIAIYMGDFAYSMHKALKNKSEGKEVFASEYNREQKV